MLYFSKHNGTVTNSLKQYFETLGDGDYTVEVKKAKKIRSPEQNNLYWTIVEIMSRDSGYTTEDLHEILKKDFLRDQYVVSKNDKRKKRKLRKSTTRLTTEEFGIYIEKVKQLGQNFFNIDWNKYLNNL